MAEGGPGRGLHGDRRGRDHLAARERQAGHRHSDFSRRTDVHAERVRGSVVDTPAYQWAFFAVAAAFTVAAILALTLKG
jgi:hypothetical protein